MEYSCTSTGFLIETKMKELILFLEKGISKLTSFSGIPTKWGSQNDMFLWNFFKVKLYFLTPEKLGSWKITDTQQLKKKSFIHI